MFKQVYIHLTDNQTVVFDEAENLGFSLSGFISVEQGDTITSFNPNNVSYYSFQKPEETDQESFDFDDEDNKVVKLHEV